MKLVLDYVECEVDREAKRVVVHVSDEQAQRLTDQLRPSDPLRHLVAATFLAQWVSGAEEPVAGRLEKRIANAFTLADLVWAKAHEVKP